MLPQWIIDLGILPGFLLERQEALVIGFWIGAVMIFVKVFIKDHFKELREYDGETQNEGGNDEL